MFYDLTFERLHKVREDSLKSKIPKSIQRQWLAHFFSLAQKSSCKRFNFVFGKILDFHSNDSKLQILFSINILITVF